MNNILDPYFLGGIKHKIPFHANVPSMPVLTLEMRKRKLLYRSNNPFLLITMEHSDYRLPVMTTAPRWWKAKHFKVKLKAFNPLFSLHRTPMATFSLLNKYSLPNYIQIKQCLEFSMFCTGPSSKEFEVGLFFAFCSIELCLPLKVNKYILKNLLTKAFMHLYLARGSFTFPVSKFIHCKDKMPKIWNKYS